MTSINAKIVFILRGGILDKPYKFIIQTSDNKVIRLDIKDLVQKIKEGKLIINNIDTTDISEEYLSKLSLDNPNKVINYNKIENKVAKAKMLGLYEEALVQYGRKTCGVIRTDDEMLVIIPNDIEVIAVTPMTPSGILRKDTEKPTLEQLIRDYSRTIRVFGGESLKNVNSMFYRSLATEIDISEMYTANIKSMADMFRGCNRTVRIIVRDFDMRGRDRPQMFEGFNGVIVSP